MDKLKDYLKENRVNDLEKLRSSLKDIQIKNKSVLCYGSVLLFR